MSPQNQVLMEKSPQIFTYNNTSLTYFEKLAEQPEAKKSPFNGSIESQQDLRDPNSSNLRHSYFH